MTSATALNTIPPPSVLRAHFSYDPETGVLAWRHRSDARRGWNTRFAGHCITTLDRYGYIQVRLKPMNLRAHRIIWAIMTGEWPGADVDHINGVRNDNRWSNLRAATRSQNNHNRHTPRRTAYPKGVTLHKASGLFRAYVNLDRKQHSLGYYRTVEEASAAYAAKAPAFLGEFYREAAHG